MLDRPLPLIGIGASDSRVWLLLVALLSTMVIKTLTCNFSQDKIYPGHGKVFVRLDAKVPRPPANPQFLCRRHPPERVASRSGAAPAACGPLARATTLTCPPRAYARRSCTTSSTPSAPRRSTASGTRARWRGRRCAGLRCYPLVEEPPCPCGSSKPPDPLPPCRAQLYRRMHKKGADGEKRALKKTRKANTKGRGVFGASVEEIKKKRDQSAAARATARAKALRCGLHSLGCCSSS
jgi:hypothetical protein